MKESSVRILQEIRDNCRLSLAQHSPLRFAEIKMIEMLAQKILRDEEGGS